MNQEQLMDFIQWLPTKFKEFQDKAPEQIVGILNELSQTTNGKRKVEELVNIYKQEISQQSEMFKKGGKLNYFVKKFQKGGLVNQDLKGFRKIGRYGDSPVSSEFDLSEFGWYPWSDNYLHVNEDGQTAVHRKIYPLSGTIIDSSYSIDPETKNINWRKYNRRRITSGPFTTDTTYVQMNGRPSIIFSGKPNYSYYGVYGPKSRRQLNQDIRDAKAQILKLFEEID